MSNPTKSQISIEESERSNGIPATLLESGEIVFNRYEVIGRIGYGGMAQVYKASDLDTGEDFALKICTRKSDAARFDREVRAMSEIRSANVMSIVASGDHNGLPFLVMPLAQQTLDDVQFSTRESREIMDILHTFLEICEGVNAIHKNGWLHRDIKPSNILQVDGVWVISDLGLSKNPFFEGDLKLTKTGIAPGTRQFMAPEQCAGNNKAIDQTTDVFQLGLVLLQMLTGAPPTQVFDLSEFPSQESAILKKCLKKDQASRYSNVGALMVDARALANHYVKLLSSRSADDDSGPDPVDWIDSSYFADTCRKAYRASYAQVRGSQRWGLVLAGVHSYWQVLFSRFDTVFVEGKLPSGCKAGAGPNGLLKELGGAELAKFEAVEKDVIRWLAFRRLILAAVRKYPEIASKEIDGLLVLFLNYVAPDERSQEWRQHVVRFRPWLTKIGLRPKDLASGLADIPNLGFYERQWLDSFEPQSPIVPWWDQVK